MPLIKFRSEDEARQALTLAPQALSLGARIAGLWDFSSRLAPLPFSRGVFRFRGLEEANRHRREWERDRARRLRQRVVAGDRLVF